MNILIFKRVALAAILTLGAMALTSPNVVRGVEQTTPQSTMMPMPGMGGGMGGGMGQNGSCHAMGGMMSSASTPAEIAMRDAMMGAMGAPRSGKAATWSGNPDLDYVTIALRHARATLAMARVEVKYGKDPEAIAFARTTIAAQNAAIEKLKAMRQSMHR